MPSPQKIKGSNWERDVAKYLTELYGETFIRAPGSGAYVGGVNSVRKQILHEGQIRAFKGDIVPGASFPHLNIECKSYADFPFHQLFQGTVKILEEWLDQLMTVADEGDFNLLIMKFNRKGKFIAFQAHCENLISVRHINYGSIKHCHWHIMDFDTFWELNHSAVKDLSA